MTTGPQACMSVYLYISLHVVNVLNIMLHFSVGAYLSILHPFKHPDKTLQKPENPTPTKNDREASQRALTRNLETVDINPALPIRGKMP